MFIKKHIKRIILLLRNHVTTVAVIWLVLFAFLPILYLTAVRNNYTDLYDVIKLSILLYPFLCSMISVLMLKCWIGEKHSLFRFRDSVPEIPVLIINLLFDFAAYASIKMLIGKGIVGASEPARIFLLCVLLQSCAKLMTLVAEYFIVVLSVTEAVFVYLVTKKDCGFYYDLEHPFARKYRLIKWSLLAIVIMQTFSFLIIREKASKIHKSDNACIR